ncbi:MAG TPA: 3-carboxy-cis,cis-muconate cycloisomerase [Hypericibacter adhaerens]|uniref:3-carboxy-cis,cis-muconate cycloisomerase n=1 Tax=Hypericibacter adhaerens TaxID=2602016 RepID=UPI002BD6510E|nr:3-carboxy-cis,cis-muconate cycloisomerase [Hypericibacter adhaerens]HWA42173.1 3-carboxy-cis,cis-muconate cycloisomerase [Hypericibacter adhaerens]
MSPFDHPLLSGLLGDDEVAPYFLADAEIQQMLRFEQELALAEGALGVIPAEAAQAIAGELQAFVPNYELIRRATVRDGVVCVELIRQLREFLGSPLDRHVHFGATSQDLVDTGLLLRLRPILGLFDQRLAALELKLGGLAERFGGNQVMARTRMQDALPIAVGEKLQTWRAPLGRHRARLAQLSPRLFVLQFGGAAGTLDRLGDRGPQVAARLAAALELGVPERAWHSQRDGIVELAGWLSLVSGALGKIGADVALMAQNRFGDIELEGGGGSSAMPHKSNPIAAEILVALAHFNAGLTGGINGALIHEQERSGAAWTLEWLILPQMIMATGAALRTAQTLLGQILRIGRAP